MLGAVVKLVCCLCAGLLYSQLGILACVLALADARNALKLVTQDASVVFGANSGAHRDARALARYRHLSARVFALRIPIHRPHTRMCADVVLYRSGPSALSITGALKVTGTLTIGGKQFVPRGRVPSFTGSTPDLPCSLSLSVCLVAPDQRASLLVLPQARAAWGRRCFSACSST